MTLYVTMDDSTSTMRKTEKKRLRRNHLIGSLCFFVGVIIEEPSLTHTGNALFVVGSVLFVYDSVTR